VRSDLRGGPATEDNGGSPDGQKAYDEVSVKVGTAASQANNEEDRGSVVSKGSVGK